MWTDEEQLENSIKTMKDLKIKVIQYNITIDYTFFSIYLHIIQLEFQDILINFWL